ncbi:hypothetical protein M2360_003680 [Rhizobium sp. SG_E_25_P2]|uniref:hypothetical protein n=1 Tax=Rhizobium sp. SG_E_25_P2 TaxID=2879942 RepID=UPI0024765E7A|nr:hypothetical protein [Rhizobium sp. SG_E_25_P2]MDH6268275.1 hypothetical protein [Rhizobium sp. SG_E_25_P2]
MTAIYMNDEDHSRYVDSILDSFLGGILKDRIRDDVVLALGEHLGIWPESSRSDDEE